MAHERLILFFMEKTPNCYALIRGLNLHPFSPLCFLPSKGICFASKKQIGQKGETNTGETNIHAGSCFLHC